MAANYANKAAIGNLHDECAAPFQKRKPVDLDEASHGPGPPPTSVATPAPPSQRCAISWGTGNALRRMLARDRKEWRWTGPDWKGCGRDRSPTQQPMTVTFAVGV
ncbi:hypothetical protein GWI33_008366 [Rhynchophorus ferrugineus]|uniref:Uncharacterized protein n=1 Tax=Rhynchophorus ferrugineus TaxID=354439 RepID=A0A834MMK5_RHYFE|nr:hypothetical protein GWI33_008366 [Rhynchophorus ferrugineus]